MSKYDRDRYPQPEIAFVAPDDLKNDAHKPSVGYQYMEPDYRAKAYPGAPFWQRFVYPKPHDREHPGEFQMLRQGLQNAVGSQYQLRPTGKRVPLTAFIVNPFERTSDNGRSGFTSVQPTVSLANGQATVAIPATIRRDRERY